MKEYFPFAYICLSLHTGCANADPGGSSCHFSGPGGLVQIGGGNQQRSHISDSLAWHAGEQQLEENRLLLEYLKNNSFSDIETLLTQSGTAESQKLLAQYYFGMKDYTGSRTALSNIVSYF